MSTEESWNEARRDVTALGEKLKKHYEAEGPEEAAQGAVIAPELLAEARGFEAHQLLAVVFPETLCLYIV